MSTPKISVIVPVYKVEQYLHRCIDSILAQTFTDFELLLINDGSPDNCGAICDDYAIKDSRIRVFHKENGGVSSARNLGLDNAKGEWIAFVDADDWIENEYFEAIFKKKKISENDLIRVGYNQYVSEDLFDIKKPQTAILECNNLELLTSYFANAIYAYFIRKKIIVENRIRFSTSIRIGEDKEFMTKCVLHSKRISILDFSFYHYCFNGESAFRSNMNYEKILDNLLVAKNIYQYIEKNSSITLKNSQLKNWYFSCFKSFINQIIFYKPSLVHSVLKKDLISTRTLLKDIKFSRVKNLYITVYAKFPKLVTPLFRLIQK